MPLDCSFFLGEFDSSEPAEEEMWIIAMSDEVFFVLADIELTLEAVLVRFGGEIVLVVLEGGQKLVAC